MKKIIYPGLILMLAMITLSGCRESDERRHPLYVKALQDRQAGDGAAAAEKLCELLKRRPRSIHVHKLLASIYDEMLNDPNKAVYHYQAYLQTAPDAEDAGEVKAWLLQAEKRCYALLHERFGKTDLPAAPQQQEEAPKPETASTPRETASTETGAELPDANTPEPAAEKTPEVPPQPDPKDKEIAGLKLKLAQYKARYNTMRGEVEKARKERFSGTAPQVSTAVQPSSDKSGVAVLPTEKVTEYRVVPGDTPGGIARKVYGKSSLYYLIMRANPQVDARKLRPGMVLNIPDRSENKPQGTER